MTLDLTAFLKKMTSTSGLSAYEEPIRTVIEEGWRPLVDELSVSRLGSLHGLRRGTGAEPRPSVMISTHMDAIGLMVTEIIDGFLRVTEIGGLDPRVLPGQIVTVHATRGAEAEDLPGMIVQPRIQLLPAKEREASVAMERLFVDTGLLPRDVERKVRVGDLISFAQPPMELAGGALAGHSMDNRASVAVLTHCLQELQNRQHAWDVWAVASTQEEETLGGAETSAFQLHPTFAIIVDVTFAASPGSPSHRTVPMGKGPSLVWGPNIHPALFKALKEQAERLEIPYTLETAPRHTGTDTYAIQVSAEGIPSVLIGLPLRYMHTPVEVVMMKDITRAGRLMAEFIAGLAPDFGSKLTWDD